MKKWITKTIGDCDVHRDIYEEGNPKPIAPPIMFDAANALVAAHNGEQEAEQETELLRVVKAAYLKHHVGKDDIGWDKLADMMQNALCNAMGDDAFCSWLDSETEER
jgi:hypothetical protein